MTASVQWRDLTPVTGLDRSNYCPCCSRRRSRTRDAQWTPIRMQPRDANLPHSVACEGSCFAFLCTRSSFTGPWRRGAALNMDDLGTEFGKLCSVIRLCHRHAGSNGADALQRAVFWHKRWGRRALKRIIHSGRLLRISSIRSSCLESSVVAWTFPVIEPFRLHQHSLSARPLRALGSNDSRRLATLAAPLSRRRQATPS